MNEWNLKDLQMDVLKEVGNIGAGNAATALSKLVQKNIDMKVPKVRVLSFDDIANYLGGPEEVVVGVFLRIEGDVPGSMFYFLQVDTALAMVRSFLGEQGTQDALGEMELSVIQEIGNILSGSYLSSLSDLTKLNLQPSVPGIAIDMSAAILSHGLIEVGIAGDYALLIDTIFLNIEGSEQNQIEGQFVLLPDPQSFTTLFDALGVPYHD